MDGRRSEIAKMLHFRKFTLNSILLPLTSNDQKHSKLLGNTFQPFNIWLKPVCNRYERFWTQQSPFQNYAYFCKNPYLAHLSRRLTGELTVYTGIRRPSVRRPSTFSNDISSEAVRWILSILHI